MRFAARRFPAEPMRRNSREISDPRLTPMAMAMASETALASDTSPLSTSFWAMDSSPK